MESRRCSCDFLEQDGPQDAKMEGGGEKFRMSERQRVAELPSTLVLRVARKSCLKYSYAAIYKKDLAP